MISLSLLCCFEGYALSIDAYGVHVASLYIRFYAVILMAGMVVGAWFSARRAKQLGHDPNIVWDGLLWAIIPGLIGARIYHILTPTDGLTLSYYLQNPLQMLEIWNGGLGIYGAVAGGALGILYYARRRKQSVPVWFDIVVPGLALAQAIGRWGNFINQELYGGLTNLPWGLTIPQSKRVGIYTDMVTYPEATTRFHPLFLYESLLNVAACGMLIWIERRFRGRLRNGDLFLIYLMMYPTIRFLLDFVRLDSNTLGIITTAQFVSLLTFIGAGALLFIRHRRPMPSTAKDQVDAA